MSVNQAPQVSRLVRLFDSDKSIRRKSPKPAIKGSQTSSQDIQRVGKYLESSLSESHSNNVWLFAYGSLVWDSDFEYKERHTGFIHGFKRRYNWIDCRCRGLPGSEGRIVSLRPVNTDASEEDLVEYKKLPLSLNHLLDGKCCWGTAYRLKRNKWEECVEEMMEKRHPEGFKQIKTTFYPTGEEMAHIEDVLVYVVDEKSEFQSESSISEIADIIINATGAKGSNVNYAINLAQGLRNMDISESKAKHVFEVEKVVKKRIKDNEQEEYLRRAMGFYFNMTDVDKNGVITVPEFIKLAINFGGDVKEGDSDVVKKQGMQIMRSIDKDDDGLINREEFIKYFLDRYRSNNESGRRASLKRVIARKGLNAGLQKIDLVDRILFGIQQIDANELSNESSSELMGLEDYLDQNQEFYSQLESLANAKAKEILKFMFPNSMAECMNLWFGKSPQTDDYITKTFGKMVLEARDGKYDDWIAHPLECLALIILLDQFPRNIYRHKREMYASDYKAQGIVSQILYLGHHRYLSPLHAVFMPCLVLTHAENVHLQNLCVTIWNHYVQKKLKPCDPLFIFENIFLYHLQVVKRYGHFPHRNEIMGRTNTPEEVRFLEDTTFRFDLPLVYGDDGSVKFVQTEEFDHRQKLVEDILEKGV